MCPLAKHPKFTGSQRSTGSGSLSLQGWLSSSSFILLHFQRAQLPNPPAPEWPICCGSLAHSRESLPLPELGVSPCLSSSSLLCQALPVFGAVLSRALHRKDASVGAALLSAPEVCAAAQA